VVLDEERTLKDAEVLPLYNLSSKAQ